MKIETFLKIYFCLLALILVLITTDGIVRQLNTKKPLTQPQIAGQMTTEAIEKCAAEGKQWGVLFPYFNSSTEEIVSAYCVEDNRAIPLPTMK